jgi:small subunit ribosomal protein S6
MSVELYETMFLMDANKVASEGEAIRTALHGLLEKHGGEILIARPWDDRKIAYSIRRAGITHKKGAYYIVYYKMESTKQGALDKDLRLNTTDYLIRYLTSQIDARWSEAILDIAKNDTAPGFALRIMQDDASPADINPATINDPNAPDGPTPGPREGGRRGRRDDGDEKPM